MSILVLTVLLAVQGGEQTLSVYHPIETYDSSEACERALNSGASYRRQFDILAIIAERSAFFNQEFGKWPTEFSAEISCRAD